MPDGLLYRTIWWVKLDFEDSAQKTLNSTETSLGCSLRTHNTFLMRSTKCEKTCQPSTLQTSMRDSSVSRVMSAAAIKGTKSPAQGTDWLTPRWWAPWVDNSSPSGSSSSLQLQLSGTSRPPALINSFVLPSARLLPQTNCWQKKSPLIQFGVQNNLQCDWMFVGTCGTNGYHVCVCFIWGISMWSFWAWIGSLESERDRTSRWQNTMCFTVIYSGITEESAVMKRWRENTENNKLFWVFCQAFVSHIEVLSELNSGLWDHLLKGNLMRMRGLSQRILGSNI